MTCAGSCCALCRLEATSPTLPDGSGAGPAVHSLGVMTSYPHERPHRRFGLPLPGIVALAALAVPRVILHDLHLIEEGTFVNALFVVIPPVAWILVVLLLRVPRPFVALLAVGLVYGVFLAAGHLLLWHHAFPEGAPRLGGNLADAPPLVGELVLRGFTVISSVVTGTVVGALTGLVAAGLSALPGLRRRGA